MANQHDSGRHETGTPTRDDVARRAYELFQARGGEPGHELENWLGQFRAHLASFRVGFSKKQKENDVGDGFFERRH